MLFYIEDDGWATARPMSILYNVGLIPLLKTTSFANESDLAKNRAMEILG